MSERETEYLPYELTAEQIAKEQFEHLEEKYGNNPLVLMAALRKGGLQEIIHDSLNLGLGLSSNFGDIGLVELLEAFTAGTRYNNEGEQE